MNNRFATLIAAGLWLAAAPRTATLTSPAPHAVGEVEILVDGTPQPRYAHEGRWYVEARKGREYAIRLRNPYGVRVAVALSVDGLNTIDARETTAADARKWVLGPYETVTISGWQTSQLEARRFEFTTEARSYGRRILGYARKRSIGPRSLPSSEEARRGGRGSPAGVFAPDARSAAGPK